MIPYGRQDIDDADIDAVAGVLRGDWLTTGPAVDEFESALAEWTGGVPVTSVSSGTAALHAAYAGLGLGPGDEIITTPLTFVATQATAMLLGALPVFADISPDTGNLDPADVESRITPRTKAIVAVDYAGHPADMDALAGIAESHGLLLIEDAAHSLGSRYRGRPVGSLADVTTFSFFPTKNITTGEGGAVAAKDPVVLDRIRRFTRQGLVRESAMLQMPDEGPWHQEVHSVGLNYRLPDMNAVLGTSQLRRLAGFKQRRQEIKARYDEGFADVAGLTVPVQRPDCDPLWHLYPLRVPAPERRRIFEALREQGIGVQVNYIPAYWHPALAHLAPRGACPVAEVYYAQEISLPMHVRLTDDEVDAVVVRVRHAMEATP
jgi:dTDP-4-amino-4,6-dideoxygalactose transaminase